MIPAAGLGSRLGGAGSLPKPLVPFRGTPLVLHAVENALAVCSRCVVVTGHRHREVRDVLRGEPRVTVVYNPRYQEGMVTSIAAGLAEATTPWCFIAPADMPFLSPDVYRALCAAVPHPGTPAVSGEPTAIFPVYCGRRGHPVLVQTHLHEPLTAWLSTRDTSQEVAMRDFLARYPVQEVSVGTESISTDLDTAEQIAAATDGSPSES